MSARYGCSTEIHLPAITSPIAASVEGLKKILKWINDAPINDESASDGTVWLNVQCPEQNCGHSFVKDLDEAIDDPAQYALDGLPSSICTRAIRALISKVQSQSHCKTKLEFQQSGLLSGRRRHSTRIPAENSSRCSSDCRGHQAGLWNRHWGQDRRRKPRLA